MKNEAWAKVERIFHTALGLSVEDREKYLKRECTGDCELYSEVETLLISYEEDPAFLDEPVFEIGLGALGKKSEKNLTGETIGFYQLEEKIGAGGMGEVYKALDSRLNRNVALKFLSPFFENDNSAKRLLIKEAQAVAMLEHPNICAIHSIEQNDEHDFIVMQFIEGITLAERIEREPVSVDEFKNVARQIVAALAFAHSHGVIHRDVKPGNIMLTDNGEIKVLDFGIAKVVQMKKTRERETDHKSNFSKAGAMVGTVSYMSPEQLRGKRLDYRSDIFSMGITLHELITGQNPFERGSQAETIAAILCDEPPDIKTHSPDFPINLANLVDKCLEKNAEDRIQSAAEILVELDKPDAPFLASSIFNNPLKYFAITVLTVVVLMLFFAAGYVLYSNRKSPQRTLAVLPFSFDNPLIEKEYLADGLTQSIIDKLTNLSDLKVKNSYSVAIYKGETAEPQKAGKELNADAVFIGSIIKRDANLYLKTKLIRTSDGLLIDTDEAEIEDTNLIELQETVVARIINKIKLDVNAADKKKLAKKDTDSEDAKRLYMQGRFLLKTRKNIGDLDKAIQAFTDAKDFDQNYAKAWTGLADAYLLKSLPGVKNPLPPSKAVSFAKPAAERALELDNTLSETYTSLGLINSKYEWNWREAESNFRSAIYLDPEFVPARIGLISVLNMLGRFDEAMDEAITIKAFDPLSVSSNLDVARIWYRKKEFEQMDKLLSELFIANPDHKGIKYVRSYQFLCTGKFKEAAEILKKIYDSGNDEDKIFAAAPLGFAYAKMKRIDDAKRIIAELEMSEKTGYVPSQEKALIYVGLGDYDNVFENLNKSCKEKFPTLPGWITDPVVDEVKFDPRFVEIKKCVNL